MGQHNSTAAAEERELMDLTAELERASFYFAMGIPKRSLRVIAEMILNCDRSAFQSFEGAPTGEAYPIVVLGLDGRVRIDHHPTETMPRGGGQCWQRLELFVSDKARPQLSRPGDPAPAPATETVLADPTAVRGDPMSEPADKGSAAAASPFTILLFMASGQTIKIRGVVEFGWRRGYGGGPFNWLKIVQTNDPTLGRIIVPTLRLSDIVGAMQLPGGARE